MARDLAPQASVEPPRHCWGRTAVDDTIPRAQGHRWLGHWRIILDAARRARAFESPFSPEDRLDGEPRTAIKSRRVQRLFPRLMQNLPAAKPELWRAPLKAVERRFALSVQHWCDPGFAQRPYIAALAYDDLVMEVTPSDTIGKAIALTGIYEFAPTELVRAYLKDGDFFVDVGANAGYYSLVAARRVGERGRVVAFEPFTRVRQRLLRNIELNALRQVTVRTEAVGRTRGRVHLAPPTIVGNDGTATISANPVAGGLDVDCAPLDDIEGMPDLVKIDVEGHEAEVFAGMDRLLGSESAPTLLFESFRIAEDRAVLERHGYSVHVPVLRSGRLSLQPVTPQTRYYRDWEAPNFWAVKNERGRRFVSDECGARVGLRRSI